MASIGPAGFACAGSSDRQRIDSHRLGDILERRRPEIGDRQVEPRSHLPIRVFREADCAGPSDALEACGDVDAVAHQIAIGLLDHVAEMNADAEFDSAVVRHAGIALDHAALNLDGAAHRIDNAAELDQSAVACALDHAPVVHSDRRIEEIAPQRAKPSQDAVLVRAGKTAEADDVSRQNGGQFPALGHEALGPAEKRRGSPKSWAVLE